MLSLSVHGENHRTVCMIVFLFPYSYNRNQSQLRLIPIRNKKTKDRVGLHALHVVLPACCRAVYPHYGT